METSLSLRKSLQLALLFTVLLEGGVQALASVQAGGGSPEWQATFGGEPGTSGSVSDFVTFDDGSGAALYVGGSFFSAGGVDANRIAKWNGSSWSALAGGVNNCCVTSLAVFDDGTGAALYAGGFFTTAGSVAANNIAKWDGTSWTALGAGIAGPIRSLEVYDDGTGPALFAGGDFATAGSVAASNLARWNGSSWSALGSGTDGPVNALEVFDDGSGPMLIAGGEFTEIGGLPFLRMARWNGASWQVMGGGTNSSVFALQSFDDGAGSDLYVGGAFSAAGQSSANGAAKWDGIAWSPLGISLTSGIRCLNVFDDGSGAALYASGFSMTGVSGNHLGRWDGSAWTVISGGTLGEIEALAVFDDGTGEALYTGGSFFEVDGESASNVARWDGSNWSAFDGGLDGTVLDLLEYDDGGGKELFAAGYFRSIGGQIANRIAAWDGNAWTTLDGGMDGNVNSIAAFDDGGGVSLFAGGDFQTAGNVVASGIARWNGTQWSTVGSGMNDFVSAVATYDDGSGEALYVAGAFTSAGGVAANGIAKWNGTVFSPLAGGVTSGSPFSSVFALQVFDDGNGPALYAGGTFTQAGGAPASRIAKWDGAAWTPLAGGVNAPFFISTRVTSLTVFDDGAGAALYVGGRFRSAGGVAANNIARWDGLAWSALNSGLENGAGAGVFALSSHDDGSGPTLFAGGTFEFAEGSSAANIAKWNGASWSPLDQGTNGTVTALAQFELNGQRDLYVGGNFSSAFDSGDSFLAKWGKPRAVVWAFCNGNQGASALCTPCPCGNDAGSDTTGGCLNSSGTSANLIPVGIPAVSSGSETLHFDLTGANVNAFALLVSGPNLLPALGACPPGSGIVSLTMDGLRCVGGGITRHGSRALDAVGNTVSGWGPPGNPINGIGANAGFLAGQTRHFQAFYRENPALGCQTGQNSSNAVSVTFF